MTRSGEVRELTLEELNELLELQGLLQFADDAQEETELWEKINELLGRCDHGLCAEG